MSVSAARREKASLNSGKRCGARTADAVAKVKFDAFKHGLRAESRLLAFEDPQELKGRSAAWVEALAPCDAVELSLVHDAVEYSWMQDRARRAQAARITLNINNAGRDEAQNEADEVLKLGEQLFHDDRGPLAVFPHEHQPETIEAKPARRVSRSKPLPEPLSPQRLVLRLQSTAGGCQWLLDRWAELKEILDLEWMWDAPDKLKAVRLLGRQPLDAVDDRDVLMIFAACQAIEGCPGTRISEIENELQPHERGPYYQRLSGRGINGLTPINAAAGRVALIEIIERVTGRLRRTVDDHRSRAAANAALMADALSFDDSREGERLRRFELACGRGMARSLDTLLKLRRRAVQSDEFDSGEISKVDETTVRFGESLSAAREADGITGSSSCGAHGVVDPRSDGVKNATFDASSIAVVSIDQRREGRCVEPFETDAKDAFLVVESHADEGPARQNPTAAPQHETSTARSDALVAAAESGAPGVDARSPSEFRAHDQTIVDAAGSGDFDRPVDEPMVDRFGFTCTDITPRSPPR